MTASGPPPVSQLVVQDLTRDAIFLVATINPGMANRSRSPLVLQRPAGTGPCGRLQCIEETSPA